MHSSKEVQNEKEDETANLLDRIYISSNPNNKSGEKRPLPVNRELGKVKFIENKYGNSMKEVSEGNNLHIKLSDKITNDRTKHLAKGQKTIILGRPLTRLVSHSSSTIITKISHADFNDSLSEAFQQIMSAFDEKSVPQCNEDLLVLETLERHLRCLQTIFIDKYESLSKRNIEGEKKFYKLVAVIENDSGRLVLKESETRPMLNILPAFSIADFELKLKRCFTDMMSSFVDRVKTYLTETGQKDLEQMMELFESEQNKQCSLLLNWLAKKSKVFEQKLNSTKHEPLEYRCIGSSQSDENTASEQAKELEKLKKEAEIKEANVLMEADTKFNKLLNQLGELEKSKKSTEDKLNKALEMIERERNIFQNILKSEKKKHMEVVETQEEKIKSYEKSFEEFKGKTTNIENIFDKINANLEHEKQKNLKLMLELYEIQTKEKEFKDTNTDLTEKLNSDAQAQGVKIENLRKKLNETEEILQNLRNFNKERTEERELKRDTKESSSTQNLLTDLNKKNEEIMILEKTIKTLKDELEQERNSNDSKLADITNQLNETQEHESELEKLNLELEKKLEIIEGEKISEMAQFAFKLKESQELVQELGCENSKLKESFEKLRKEKDGAKTRLLSNLKQSQDRVKELKAANSRLLKDLRDQTHCNEDKNALLDELSVERQNVSKLKDFNNHLSSKCSNIEYERRIFMEHVKKELVECKTNLENLKESNARLVESYKMYHKKYHAKLEFVKDLKEIRLSLKDLRQMYANGVHNFIKLDEERRCTIENLTNELGKFKEYIQKLQNENNTLKEQVSKRVDSQDEEIQVLNRAVNESLDLVSELTEKLASEKEANEKLQEELNESQTRARDLELVYAELSRKLEDDGQESSIAEEMLNDLIDSRKTVKQLEITNEELTRKMQIQQNRGFGNYSIKFDRLRAEKRDLRVSIDEHLEKLSTCNEAVNTLKGVIAHKDQTLELKTKHIETLKREIRELFHDLETLREMVISKNKQIGRLESKLSTSTEHFHTLFSSFGHKHAECFEIEEKCRVMRDSITRGNKIRKSQEETIDLLKRKIHHLDKTM